MAAETLTDFLKELEPPQEPEWVERRRLQAVTIVNFIRFLAAEKFRLDLASIKPDEMDSEMARNSVSQLKTARDLIKLLDEWIKKYLYDNQTPVQDGFIMFLEHKPDNRTGFIFKVARKGDIGDKQVLDIFPYTFQLLVGKRVVRHRVREDCMSSLLDKDQIEPWTEDMINRQEPELQKRCSITNTCRNVEHQCPMMPPHRLLNVRCPKVVAQERLDRVCDDLGVRIVGRRGPCVVRDRLLSEELSTLDYLKRARCSCRRCGDLTIPARILLTDITANRGVPDTGLTLTPRKK